MKKSKLLALGLIALMLAGGLVLASCDKGCNQGGDCFIEGGNASGCTIDSCAVNKAWGTEPAGRIDCDC